MHGNIPATSGSQDSLTDLTARIRRAHENVITSFRNAIEHALEAGKALNEVKDSKRIPHGQWAHFLRDCDIGERTAQRYMQLAVLAKASPGTVLDGADIKAAIRKLSPPERRGPKVERNVECSPKPKVPTPTVAKNIANSLDWTAASLDQRRRLLDAIGWRSLLEAIPPSWLPLLKQHFAAPEQPPQRVTTELPADLSIPDFLKRAEAEKVSDAAPPQLDPEPAEPIKIISPLVTPVYDVGRSRVFCGPTAMSAVTGEPISVIRDAVRQASGKITKKDGSAWPVMGMHNKDLIAAMRLLGWRVAERWRERRRKGDKPYTLDAFAKDHGHDGPFIVNVTGHYVAISQGEFCDTATVLPKDLFAGVLDRNWFDDRKRKGSTWVRAWWRFEKHTSDRAEKRADEPATAETAR